MITIPFCPDDAPTPILPPIEPLPKLPAPLEPPVPVIPKAVLVLVPPPPPAQ